MWGMIANVNWQVDAYLFTLSVRHMCRDRHGGGNLRFPKRLCAIINVLASSAGFVRSKRGRPSLLAQYAHRIDRWAFVESVFPWNVGGFEEMVPGKGLCGRNIVPNAWL